MRLRGDKRSQGEEELLQQMRLLGLPEPVREYQFDARPQPRRWRCDFAWPDLKVAAEVEGGVWTGGRHTRPAGYTSDAEKYTEAALQGWIVLRFTTAQVRDGSALAGVERAIEGRLTGYTGRV